MIRKLTTLAISCLICCQAIANQDNNKPYYVRDLKTFANLKEIHFDMNSIATIPASSNFGFKIQAGLQPNIENNNQLEMHGKYIRKLQDSVSVGLNIVYEFDN